MMTPGAWPINNPGAWLEGFMLGTANYCYTQNIKALDLMVSEKKIFFMFSNCKSMGDDDPWGLAN